jgi:hypothetical protein
VRQGESSKAASVRRDIGVLGQCGVLEEPEDDAPGIEEGDRRLAP